MRSAVPGIDVAKVSAFLAERVPGTAGEPRFELVGAGRSNLTYRVHAGAQSWVLRRPPLGHVLPTAHDMAREFRVLAALADTQVPVPRPIVLCEDASVNGAPFYVMEYRAGVVLEAKLPPGFAAKEEERRAMSLALVGTLVDLHAVDYAARGLADFGRPEGYLERQVRRWGQQWERSKTRDVPEVEELRKLLAEELPRSPAPTIVHGDFRLGNLALDPSDPGRVCAVFDWEMSTLGDPLSDLGYTLIYWGDPGDALDPDGIDASRAITAQPGFLTRAELVETYGRASGRDVSAIAFYQRLALYKLAVIAEGIYARFLAGQTVGSGFEHMGRHSPRLARRALDLPRL